MEHDAIFTENIPKVASIKPLERSFESADVGAQNCQPHEYRNVPHGRVAKPNSKSMRETYKHVVHLVGPRKLRREAGEDASEIDSDAVFRGLLNR